MQGLFQNQKRSIRVVMFRLCMGTHFATCDHDAVHKICSSSAARYTEQWLCQRSGAQNNSQLRDPVHILFIRWKWSHFNKSNKMWQIIKVTTFHARPCLWTHAKRIWSPGKIVATIGHNLPHIQHMTSSNIYFIIF